MQIQDKTAPISIEDLLQRYKLEDVENIQTNVSSVKSELQIVDNELQNFKTVTLGLLGEIEEQIDGKVVTWFLSGEPTLNNQPAVGWTTEEKESHLNDLYFDKSTGYVYYFAKESGVYKWIKTQDQDIASAMSIASSAQDTADGKRRVFLTTPTPPYDKGDLWKSSDGNLYSCKTAKTKSQSYSANDWEKAITKLQGEVFISTGEQMVGGSGVLSVLQFNSGDFDLCGHKHIPMGYPKLFEKKPLTISVHIPENFTIIEAKIVLHHAPVYWVYEGSPTPDEGYGWAKKICAYKQNITTYTPVYYMESDIWYPDPMDVTEIIGAFGPNGYTSPEPTILSHDLVSIASANIKDSLNIGLNVLKIQPKDELTFANEMEYITAFKNCSYCYAVVNIVGYKK